jgi:hypothetical protein
MYKILSADSDTYVNNRIIGTRSCEKSNVGIAGTLDLFKIHGLTFDVGGNPNTEFSRAFIHFDLQPLIELHQSGKLDIQHESFFCRMTLKDVYGGQPTPEKFTLLINPMSSSFYEGLGKDVVKYEDLDVSNFITASRDPSDEPVPWKEAGCSMSGSIGDECDFFTGSLQRSQYFKTGEEDLDIDVTDVIRATIAGEIPDSGFRISMPPELESNERTYFVKRFASRHAFDESKRPKLICGFDDSIRDTSEFLYTDTESSFVLYNFENGHIKNLKDSSGLEITGDDCILLRVVLPPSGTYYFTGSQKSIGGVTYEGTYHASGSIPYGNVFLAATAISGSKVKTKCSWMTIDEDKVLVDLDDKFIFRKPAFDQVPATRQFVVTSNVKASYRHQEKSIIRVNVFDPNSPAVVASRVAVPSPGGFQGVIADAFYQIRDSTTQEVTVPFDFDKGCNRLSSDSRGMFFRLDASNLNPEKTYVIDVALKCNGDTQIHTNTSPIFKVTNLQ